MQSCSPQRPVSARCWRSNRRPGTWCYASEADGVSPDLKISGCSTLILSGTLPNSGLATAYSNRGSAYSDKDQLDRAIQDYDQAIKLDPSNAIGPPNPLSGWLETSRW